MKKIAKDNGGSGIVTVIIAVSFIGALAVALLLLGFTNLHIKISDRAEKQNFYSADEALTEIKVRLQEYSTRAVAAAYTNVLVDYSAAASDENKTAFARAFVEALNQVGGGFEGGDKAIVITPQTGGGIYDLSVIWPEYDDQNGIDINTIGIIEVDYNSREIIFKGFDVSCTRRGYESNISTDIAIRMPDFSYTLSSYSLSGLYENVLVAKESLIVGDAGATISGRAYGGKVEVSGNLALAEKATLSAGRRGDSGYGIISFLGGSHTFGVDSALWAKRLDILGSNVSLNLAGKTYIADDLQILGDNAEITATGRYYGFGWGLLRDGERSSAINIAGKGAVIDFSAAETVMIAGRSFVDGEGSGDILMGTSVSVKSDQVAYLVPEKLITVAGSEKGAVANPFVLGSGAAVPQIDVDVNTGFFAREGATLSLDEMGAAFERKIYKLPSTGDNVVYVFMVFDDPNDALLYFKDYYTDNKGKVDNYLEYYVKRIDLGALTSHGLTYSGGGQSWQLNDQSAEGIAAIAPLLEGRYENMVSSLSETSGSGAATPFEHFVSITALDRVANEPEVFEFTDEEGKVRGLVVPAGFYNSGSDAFNLDATNYPHVNVVVAAGNVNVRRDFGGIVLAKKDITLQNGCRVYADYSGVAQTIKTAKAAINGEEQGLAGFFNNEDSLGTSTPVAGEGQVSWELNDMVIFKNWKKN